MEPVQNNECLGFMRICLSKILFSSCSYKEVASSIRNTTHSVALLDRTNAVYGQTAIINTGTEAARESKKVPVFVPVSYNSEEKKDNR